MKHPRISLSLSLSLLTIAYCLAPQASSWAAETKLAKMRFVQSGNTSSSWPLYVAQQRKFLEKNGIDLEVIVIRGSTNLVSASVRLARASGR